MFIAFRQYIPHQVFENIFFNEGGHTTGYFNIIGTIRKSLQRIQVGIEFVVQATFQATALTT